MRDLLELVGPGTEYSQGSEVGFFSLVFDACATDAEKIGTGYGSKLKGKVPHCIFSSSVCSTWSFSSLEAASATFGASPETVVEFIV